MRKLVILAALACLAIVVSLTACKKEKPQEKPYTIRIVVTGDSGGQGRGVYGNGKPDSVLDFYNMMNDPNERVVLTMADGQMYKMVWNDKFHGFVATFPLLQGDQPLYFAVQHPSREPTAPKNWLDPVYGIYADVLSVSGKILSTTELVHYENKEYPVSEVKPVWSVVIEGVDMQTGRIRQGEENRIAEITITEESQ